MQLPLTAAARILFSKTFHVAADGDEWRSVFTPYLEAQEECVISTSSTWVVCTPNLQVKAILVNTTSIDLIKAILANTTSINLILTV